MNAAAVDELLTMEAVDDTIEGLSEDSEEEDETENNDDPKWRLYWAVRNEPNPTDPDTVLSEPFLALPSKSYYHDYYSEITSPMSLFVVNKKLKRGDYASLANLLADLRLIFENARSYNIEGSEIHDAAVKLEKLAVSMARTMQPDAMRVQVSVDEETGRTPRQYKPKRRRIKADPDVSVASSPHDSEASSSIVRSNNSFGVNTAVRASNNSIAEKTGRPGRKSLNELLIRYREKLCWLWESWLPYR